LVDVGLKKKNERKRTTGGYRKGKERKEKRTLYDILDSFRRFDHLLDLGRNATSVPLQRRRLHPGGFGVVRLGVDGLW
jgi:hypothetical protein